METDQYNKIKNNPINKTVKETNNIINSFKVVIQLKYIII